MIYKLNLHQQPTKQSFQAVRNFEQPLQTEFSLTNSLTKSQLASEREKFSLQTCRTLQNILEHSRNLENILEPLQNLLEHSRNLENILEPLQNLGVSPLEPPPPKNLKQMKKLASFLCVTLQSQGSWTLFNSYSCAFLRIIP